MNNDPNDAAVQGVNGVIEALRSTGLEVKLTPEQVVLAGELVLVLVGWLGGVSLKRAAAAGAAAAAAVTTVEEANDVLKAAAAVEEAK